MQSTTQITAGARRSNQRPRQPPVRNRRGLEAFLLQVLHRQRASGVRQESRMTTLPSQTERALRNHHQRREIIRPSRVRELPPSGSPAADYRLCDEIRRSLVATGYRVLREVTVHVSGGQIRLTGQVPSYYLKQVATMAVLAHGAGATLCNELRVPTRRGGQDSGLNASESERCPT